jgi:serine/threonine-protein kinase
MAFEAGQLLGARFRLVNLLGEGALGEVWRGTDRVPSRQVAIRMVTPNAPVARDAIDTFLGEMRTACELRHRATAKVFEVGHSVGGVPWFATELLRAESLEEVLERRTMISPGAALRLITELAEALSEAHALGLVHRGLHPRSVMLNLEDEGSVSVKLVDFGRERLFASAKGPESRMQGYRSVELSLGARATKESDVWALGVMLFRCITGRLPFNSLADTATQSSIERVLEEGLEDPSVLRIVRDCLRPARDQRISAEEVADRAQLAGWTTRGGWNDVEKMVRISESFLDPQRFGQVGHSQTIPGIFALPRTDDPIVVRPPVISEPPRAVEAAPLPSVPVSETVRSFRRYDGVLDVWAARRRLALAALLGVSAVIGGMLGAASHPAGARHAHTAPRVVEERATLEQAKPREVSVPVAMTNAATTVTAAVATIEPKAEAAPPPPAPKVASAVAPKVESAVAPPSAKTETPAPKQASPPKSTLGSDPFAVHTEIPGVPLWDPPKKPPVDDNPYK